MVRARATLPLLVFPGKLSCLHPPVRTEEPGDTHALAAALQRFRPEHQEIRILDSRDKVWRPVRQPHAGRPRAADHANERLRAAGARPYEEAGEVTAGDLPTAHPDDGPAHADRAAGKELGP